MSAKRGLTAAVTNILPRIPKDLAVAVGEVTIRFGELERVITTAMARVKSVDDGKGTDTAHFLKLVGKYKQKGPLGPLINEAKKLLGSRQFSWIDYNVLDSLRQERNSIHDALVEESDGSLSWLASGRRSHRTVEIPRLSNIRHEVEREIDKINKGSLEYKRSAAK
jgi:hypothetical protein